MVTSNYQLTIIKTKSEEMRRGQPTPSEIEESNRKYELTMER